MSLATELSVNAVLGKAEQETGLSDWGDSAFRERLQKLIHAFESDGAPSAPCREQFWKLCLQRASNRLKIQDTLANHPEILQTPISGPLFVTGLSRTGTTFLHNLLAQDPANRPLLYWEVNTPTPPPDPETRATDPRIERLARTLKEIFERLPGLAAAHHARAKAPEECNSLFSHDFAALSLGSAFYAPSFSHWLLDRDMTGPYRFYKKQLQILRWKFPPKRAVLKSPAHLPFLGDLRRVFPDARIVQTHRDPLQCLPSLCGLLVQVRNFYHSPAEPHLLGPEIVRSSARMVERAMDDREKAPPDAFLDVAYQSLVADPIATVRRIYQHFDYPYTAEFEQRMVRWIAENRQHKHGKHRYALDQFGLEPAVVRHTLQRYYDTHGSYL